MDEFPIEYSGPNKRQLNIELADLMDRMSRGTDEVVDWSQAACKGVNPDLFFCPGNTQPSASAADICWTQCPIRLQCLKFSCTAEEREGVWGGLPGDIRAGTGKGTYKGLKPYNYPVLALMGNPYDVTSRRFKYHREKLKPWVPGEEYWPENVEKWIITDD